VYIVYTGLEVRIPLVIFRVVLLTGLLQFLAVWYFFVETRGFTLEEIWTMCETPGLS
jgi:hypothetical protein